MSSHDSPDPLRALLETTVQIDRVKTRVRKEAIAAILKQNQINLSFSTSIVLLEFKATVIQECITIHDQLRLRKRFTTVRDGLVQSGHPQARLRAAIFDNWISVHGGAFEITPERDEDLGERARLCLENVIPELYRWFVEESVDAILRHRVDCTRATEAPSKKRLAFATNLPTCVAGKNKWCRVESAIRDNAQLLLGKIDAHFESSPQLAEAAELMKEVVDNPSRQLSHSNCRALGDSLIALEAAGLVTHAVSTNATEWGPLSAVLGFTFLRPDYSEEKAK